MHKDEQESTDPALVIARIEQRLESDPYMDSALRQQLETRIEYEKKELEKRAKGDEGVKRVN